ncbi:MAG TPA: type II CAAX endopeptidase family protein [Thermoanaerobaculia bacterium]|nr:type II CAAX endopeptidase family protein [Thermoanaerobaculia bacterium]
MSHYLLPLGFIALVYIAMIVLNERYGLFAADRFPSLGAKIAAYAWLGLLLFGLTITVIGSAMHVPTARELARIPFYSLFLLHGVLIVFLAGWWLLTGRPPLRELLNLRRGNGVEMTMIGFAVGVGGWIFTIIVAVLLALILNAAGVLPKPAQPPPMIAWMAALPLWKKAVVVLSAMTVEEAFFRGWLQKRVGLVASTILFALAHSGFGQPLLLIGVFIISLVIGFTFYRTKNLLPGVIAHGVFDGIQLFVVIPVLFRMMGLDG